MSASSYSSLCLYGIKGLSDVLRLRAQVECATILAKRCDGAPDGLPAKDWVKLCGKLAKKYGEDPLAL